MNNTLRIIGGKWCSRQIQFESVDGLRPTPARVRETLFNWLQHTIILSDCLDLYAGSGALSFEAASRGAKKVVQVENNATVCRQLKTNGQALSANQVTIVSETVLTFLKKEATAFDIVFIDAPFYQNLAMQTCQQLDEKNWLKSGAKVYLEVEHKLSLAKLPQQWQCLKQKTAGEVDYYLFQCD
jgi:16S rRNA (guanine966-N2)-methyltransferase